VLFLQRLVAIIVALGMVAAALVFASIVVAIMLGAAAVIGTWLWWRTRALRREVARTAPSVVEGEFREVPESRLEDRSR
jgi:hypothetical protein